MLSHVRFVLLLGLLLSARASSAPLPGGVREEHVLIPMRDGVRLSAYLYFPEGEGPWPPVFEQRYASLRGTSTIESAVRLARGGYVVALVNFRGTHESEGTWVGYRATQFGDCQDGHDVCEWLAAQPWSTGKVGTFGSSQGGFVQNYLAVTRPPRLVCQYMVDTGLSLFHEGYRIGGTTRPGRFRGLAENCRDPADNDALLEEWSRHPHYDDYWRAEDASRHFDRMDVPCFTIGSWYDFMNQGSIASFVGRQHHGGPGSRGRQWLLIGPWLHGRSNKGSKVGDLEYPENAAWDVEAHMLRWFDFWLKGRENGVPAEPAVRYYVMGADEWRSAPDWPPRVPERGLYLQAGGGLSETAPSASEGTTRYESDPLHPMEIPGRSFPGAQDARPFERQRDVVTFTTPPLSAPVEWTGRVHADLHFSSSAPDTDIVVRVSDVHPDGRSILIVDYPWRLRYREGFDHEAFLEPGTVHRVTFPVGWMSQVFRAGHRIRVTVAGSGAPLYEPNPQTGAPQAAEAPTEARKAVHTLHHSAAHPSRIFLGNDPWTTGTPPPGAQVPR
jgi:predicted acyl esterase